MGKRVVGWEDTSIVSGFGDRKNKERQYRGKKGEKHYIRVVSPAEEIRLHTVDDVATNKNGEPVTFQMICSKEWDEEKQEWVGECEGCERDYDIMERYFCCILLLGIKKGTRGKTQALDPENSVYYWDFGKDKYETLREIAIELAEAGKKLSGVELSVTCTDDSFQKLKIQKAEGKRLTTGAHVAVFKEEGQEIVDEATKAPSIAEQKRRLKKRKAKKKTEDDLFDDDEDEEVEEKPKKTKKRRVKKKPEPEPEDDDDVEDDDTGDDEIDDLLDELDG